MVRTQAQTMRPATPQRTAERRWIGADADDRAGDGVSGADGDAGQSGAEQRDGSSAFGAEAADGFEFGDFLAHGVNDAPAAEIGAGGDGGVGGKDDGPAKASPVGEHVGFAHEPGGVECAGDDAHGLLRVVAAVAEAVGGGREQLQLAKPFVDESAAACSEESSGRRS